MHYESGKCWNSDTGGSLRIIPESVVMETPTQLINWFSMELSSSSAWCTTDGGSDVSSRWLLWWSMDDIIVRPSQSVPFTITASDSMSCVSAPSNMEGLWLEDDGIAPMHRVSDESSFRGKSSVLGSSSERCASSKSCDCREKRAGSKIRNDTLIIKVYLLKKLFLPFVISWKYMYL